MDIKKIKSLIELLESSQLSALDITEGKERIRLERGSTAVFEPAPQVYKTAPEAVAAPAAVKDEASVRDFNKYFEVKSPVVGVFYQSPSPEAAPFVKKGSKVKKGDVLCIIEAMKIMNEITAEKDGEVVDICVGNGQVVEYSQVLFKMQ